MEIVRYSKDRFKSQYQSHHLEYVNYHLNDFDINSFPEWNRKTIQELYEKQKQFYIENLNDLQNGIWCFIKGHKSNQALNHLKVKVPCWTAEIPNDIIVYNVNWDYKMPITDGECKVFGFYLPQKEIHKIQNVKRLTK